MQRTHLLKNLRILMVTLNSTALYTSTYAKEVNFMQHDAMSQKLPNIPYCSTCLRRVTPISPGLTYSITAHPR
ncbi:hypothetical protein JOE11_000818 [Robbsia andropogonis]